MTPYHYVLRERVALAQSLIRSSQAPLDEVARRSGCPDAAVWDALFGAASDILRRARTAGMKKGTGTVDEIGPRSAFTLVRFEGHASGPIAS